MASYPRRPATGWNLEISTVISSRKGRLSAMPCDVSASKKGDISQIIPNVVFHPFLREAVLRSWQVEMFGTVCLFPAWWRAYRREESYIGDARCSVLQKILVFATSEVVRLGANGIRDIQAYRMNGGDEDLKAKVPDWSLSAKFLPHDSELWPEKGKRREVR
ncbi:hypothetical protein SCHPADRAFT_896918 [Schizopora paradoxa]|uniref:Uncharacterized protein n=1 Tax=Schizopora paradoxa TaxID=27342 RepID=A0A0H2RIB5_9AGAM|nr:hypothetical protein SCHPADRAFT_896918 [Schizopora paradoxa]